LRKGGEMMRKGLTYILSTCLILGVPTITQAQELGESKESVEPLIQNETITYPLNSLDSEKVNTQESYNLNLASADAPFTSTKGQVAESKANVTGELEKEIAENSGENKGELSAKPSKEVLQKEDKGALNTNALPAKKDNKKATPSLSLGIGGLNININVLGEKRLLGIGLGLPVVGNVNVNILGQTKASSAEEQSTRNTLLGVDITGSKLVGDARVGVLEGGKVLRDNEEERNGGLAVVELDNIFGKTHLGVAEVLEQTSGNINKLQSGLLLAGLKDTPFGDANFGVAEFNKVEAPDYKEVHTGLVIADVNNTPLGDGHLGIAEVKKVETPDYSEFHSGLIIGDVTNTPLGDAHLGLIEYKQTETDEYKSSNGGLVIGDIKDSPIIDDSHIGIGEFQQVEKKDPAPTQEKPKEEPKQEEQPDTKPVEGNPGNKDGNGSTQPENSEQPINQDQPSNPDQPGDCVNPGPLLPSTPVNDGSQEQSGKATSPKTGDNVTETPADIHQNTKDSETILANDQEKKDPIAKLIEELVDAGNKIILNQSNTDDLSQLQNVLDEKQKNSNHPLGSQVVLIFTSSSPTNGGSSTNGSSGSAGSNGGSGIVAYLDYAYTNDIDLNNQMIHILDELSDQWVKGPPIEPPKSSFFLVA
jgi:hypothetical protein